MGSTDWLKTLAPMLGTALAGPLGGAAASFLADKLGVKESTVEAVTAVLSSGKMTSEQIASLKVAELEFQKFLQTNKIDLAKLANEDTAGARSMQIATRSNLPAVLTIIITIGFFGVLAWMLFDDTVQNSPPLLIMLGALGAEWTACCKFWFGTTDGSAQKTNLLAQAEAIK